MRFNRAALIEAVDKALAEDRDRWLNRRRKELDRLAAETQTWLMQYGEAWSRAGLEIRRAIREGRPVTNAMLPGLDGWSRRAVFEPTRYSTPQEYKAPGELAMLRRMLDAIVDDEVTTAGMEKLGVTGRVLKDAAYYIAHGTIRS